jgi:hypothetical protein
MVGGRPDLPQTDPESAFTTVSVASAPVIVAVAIPDEMEDPFMNRFVGIILVTLMALAAPLGLAGPASASGPVESCARLAGSANFSPGWGATPVVQSITVPAPDLGILGTTRVTSCSGRDRSISSGTITASLTTVVAVGCNFSVQPAGTLFATGTATVSWNNGQTSSGPAKISADGQQQQGIFVLTIASGKFKGHTASVTFGFTPRTPCPFTDVSLTSLTAFSIV